MNSLYHLIEQLQKGLQNPEEIPEHLRWKYFIAAKQAYQFFYGKKLQQQATDILDESWDNLIILDACRYDLFVDVIDWEGELDYRFSAGSHSEEFIKENFSGREIHDTVYITANPHAYILDNQTFHDLMTLNEHHDPNLGTVPPEAVVDVSSRAAEQYPHKRLIIHFMQPHHPFINGEGLLIDERGWEFNGNEQKEGRLWKLIKDGHIKKQDAWDAYRQSLEYVLEHVADLLVSLDGKTIITSDHGNMFGERLSPIPQRIYAHPKGIFTNELVKVPWFIPQFDERRETFSEPPQEHMTIKQNEVEEQLEALGYR